MIRPENLVNQHRPDGRWRSRRSCCACKPSDKRKPLFPIPPALPSLGTRRDSNLKPNGSPRQYPEGGVCARGGCVSRSAAYSSCAQGNWQVHTCAQG